MIGWVGQGMLAASDNATGIQPIDFGEVRPFSRPARQLHSRIYSIIDWRFILRRLHKILTGSSNKVDNDSVSPDY